MPRSVTLRLHVLPLSSSLKEVVMRHLAWYVEFASAWPSLLPSTERIMRTAVTPASTQPVVCWSRQSWHAQAMRMTLVQGGFVSPAIIFSIFGVITSFISTFLAYSLTRCDACRALYMPAARGSAKGTVGNSVTDCISQCRDCL